MFVIPNLKERGKRPGVQGYPQLHDKIRGQPRLHKTLSHKTQQKKWSLEARGRLLQNIFHRLMCWMLGG